MKIETITVMQRKNLGNYEHIEISASARVEEGEEALTAMMSLKTFVVAALEGKAEEVKAPAPVVEQPVAELPPVIEEVPEVKKERKPRAKKAEVVEEVPAVPEVKKEKLVAYDSTISEHKSIFAGYLSKKYENAWKTVKPAEEIKAFTASLNGKDFLNTDGKIVESFLDLVHGFFGA